MNVAENENVENVDITMSRGGAVTGKITDEDGRPVIAESVTIFRLDQQGKRINTDAFEPFGIEGGRRRFASEWTIENARICQTSLYSAGCWARNDKMCWR